MRTLQPTVSPERIVLFPELKDRVHLSRSTIFRLERQGLFPRRRHLSTKRVGWLDSEVNEWIRTREESELGWDPTRSQPRSSRTEPIDPT